MTNIPFPSPHDADALNDYLDALAAGEQAFPASEVEVAAKEFHQLASRSDVSIPTQPVDQERGEETMQTEPLMAPISNRTRRQMAAEKKPSRSYGWLSTLIVAGLMLSMIGSAWLNREPRNPHAQLAFAPGTAEAISQEVLTPESSPWIADFDPADCTETSGLHQVEINYRSMPKSESQGYGIVGPAQSEDASAVVEQYRAMRGCETLTDAWSYWTDSRINEHRRVLNDRSRTELADLQAYYAENYPMQFMVITSDLTISPEIEAEWSARENAGIIGQPIPLEAKLNPEWGVELSDGRIAFPATNIYSFDDPAIAASGFPEEHPASTVVMIFAKEDGSWKYDDSLALCLVNCENGVGNPLDPAEAPWAQSPEDQTCTAQPRLPELVYSNNLSRIPFKDRRYAPTGEPSKVNAEAISETVRTWYSCGFQGDDIALTTYTTPLGIISLAQIESGGAGDPFVVAPYLRQWDTGFRSLVASTSDWNQIIVIDEPIRNTTSDMQWTPMFSGSTPNDANVRQMSQGFSPATAIDLEDGRVSIFAIPTIALEDRGAITYEGNRMHQQVSGVIVKQYDDLWLIDEPVLANSGVILLTQSDAWWWDESFDSTPAAMPSLPTPIGVPRGGENGG